MIVMMCRRCRAKKNLKKSSALSIFWRKCDENRSKLRPPKERGTLLDGDWPNMTSYDARWPLSLAQLQRAFKFLWHMSEKSKMWKSVNRGYWERRIVLRYSQGRQTWSWRFKFFWHLSEKSKIWKSQNRGNRECRIDLRYFRTSKFFSKKEKYRYKGKNPAGLEEKGAPFWSSGAKRRIQGVLERKKVLAPKDGYKVVTSVVLRRNGGVFSVKISTLC